MGQEVRSFKDLAKSGAPQYPSQAISPKAMLERRRKNFNIFLAMPVALWQNWKPRSS